MVLLAAPWPTRATVRILLLAVFMTTLFVVDQGIAGQVLNLWGDAETCSVLPSSPL